MAQRCAGAGHPECEFMETLCGGRFGSASQVSDTDRELQPAPGSVIHAGKSGKWLLPAKAKVVDLLH